MIKKIIISAGIILGASVVFAQGNFTYAPEYIQHLKNCSPYTDEYTAQIKTEDENSPYLNIKSTEQIIGWVNGKCVTKSTVYSLDIDDKIMVIKCSLSKDQLASMMQKMKSVNKENSTEARQILSDEMVRIIEDSQTCKVQNYLQN